MTDGPIIDDVTDRSRLAGLIPLGQYLALMAQAIWAIFVGHPQRRVFCEVSVEASPDFPFTLTAQMAFAAIAVRVMYECQAVAEPFAAVQKLVRLFATRAEDVLLLNFPAQPCKLLLDGNQIVISPLIVLI